MALKYDVLCKLNEKLAGELITGSWIKL